MTAGAADPGEPPFFSLASHQSFRFSFLGYNAKSTFVLSLVSVVKGSHWAHSPSPWSLMTLSALSALATGALSALSMFCMFCATAKNALSTLGVLMTFIIDVWNKKVSQNSNIPTEIINGNGDIFAECLCSNVSGLIKSSTFPSYLKVEDIAPIHKKGNI